MNVKIALLGLFLSPAAAFAYIGRFKIAAVVGAIVLCLDSWQHSLPGKLPPYSAGWTYLVLCVLSYIFHIGVLVWMWASFRNGKLIVERTNPSAAFVAVIIMFQFGVLSSHSPDYVTNETARWYFGSTLNHGENFLVRRADIRTLKAGELIAVKRGWDVSDAVFVAAEGDSFTIDQNCRFKLNGQHLASFELAPKPCKPVAVNVLKGEFYATSRYGENSFMTPPYSMPATSFIGIPFAVWFSTTISEIGKPL
jgi:hypothetical protein